MTASIESELFRDSQQQKAVCDRLVQFVHYNEHEERFEIPDFSEPDRIRRARTLLDLALALFDGDGHLAMTQLVNLDHETRGIVSDLLMGLGHQGGSHADQWLVNTEAYFAVSPGTAP